MQRLFTLCSLLLFFTATIQAQSVAINNNGSQAHASSILDVSSTTKEFLLPRMTAVQRLAITSPAAGLQVFQTDAVSGSPSGFYFFNGTAWVSMTAAQSNTVGWSLTGNAGTNAATNFVGTTDATDFSIATGSLPRLTVNSGGFIGIGRTIPNSPLHVTKSPVSFSLSAPSTMILENSDQNLLTMATTSQHGAGFNFEVGIVNAQGRILYNEPGIDRGLSFKTNGHSAPDVVIDKLGQMGIGTQFPLARLHIREGFAGVTAPNFKPLLNLESTAETFINLTTPTNVMSGILFGNNFNPQDGGIIYNSDETKRGLQLNTGGNNTRMVVAGNGFVGIGTKAPKSELHVVQKDGMANGLTIENAGANHRSWTFSTRSGDGLLFLSTATNVAGFFDPNSGDYVSVSDARRKTNVEEAPDVLEKLMRLGVKKYHYVGDDQTGSKQYGMLAQEAELLFPEIVAHIKVDGTDRYLVNKSAYGILAIKAIQELNRKMEEKEKINEALRQQLAAIEQRISHLEAAASSR